MSKMPNAASRLCCNQLGLARRFSSAVSISSVIPPARSSFVSASGRAGNPKAFSTAVYGNTNTSSGCIRPLFATNVVVPSTTSSSPPIRTNVNNNTYNHSSSSNFIQRSMATSNRKVIDAKNARRLKIQQKKKKNSNANKTASDTDGTQDSIDEANGTTTKSTNPFMQHEEWVRFQQSITVDGFQTGQTTTATVLKKSRGGKQARRKREKELARLGAYSEDGTTASSSSSSSEKISAVAQKFPAIRYTPEETADLLKQAYAALPPRAGKRGTRNLRRQETRWKRVRKIRSDYKAQQINAHFNKMEVRKYKRDRTKDALESAVVQNQNDLDYQGMVMKRWMKTMNERG